MRQELRSSPLTLEMVCQHFEQWRETRPHGRSKIPERLWVEAISLVGHYPVTQVCKQLHLNPGSFNEHRHGRLIEPNSSKNLHFIEVEVSSDPSKTLAVEEVEFERPDGLRMRLHHSDGFEMSSLLTHFFGGCDVSS
jgi:hypothetical protein